tara:strand:+ start:228 stop:542 length:315 start_codon:yes stop_codon:yes gene_type:complete
MSKYFYFAMFLVLGLLILQRIVVNGLFLNELNELNERNELNELNKSTEYFMNCPESYNKVVNDIQKNYVDQTRAYTPNDYIYITENVKNNLPIPVNVNFLDNKF